MHNYSGDSLYKQTLRAVYSSARRGSAYYNSRRFGVEFESLNADEEYDMATQAYMLAKNCLGKMEINEKVYDDLLRTGEDVMLGAVIYHKLGGKDRRDETGIRQEIIDNAKSDYGRSRPDFMQFVDDGQVMDFFDRCVDYGSRVIRKNF